MLAPTGAQAAFGGRVTLQLTLYTGVTWTSSPPHHPPCASTALCNTITTPVNPLPPPALPEWACALLEKNPFPACRSMRAG